MAEMMGVLDCAGSVKFVGGRFLVSSLFIRVSEKDKGSGNATTFGIDVSVPAISITNNKHTILACPEACSTFITIPQYDFSSSSQKISIKGPGFINSTPDTPSTSLKFTAVPYNFTAVLQEGGSLFIEIVDGDGD